MPTPIYRPSHIGVLKFGLETGMLAPDATVLGAAPALDYVGYGGIPNIALNENAAIVDAVGTPFGVDTVYGDRDISFRISLKLGNLNFLRYLVRTAGVSPNTFGLPVLALAGGSSNNFAGAGFTWLCRYCLCNSFTIRFQEGSGNPVMLEADFMALSLDEAAALQTVDIESLKTVGGRVMTWAHSDILVGSTSYRSYLGGATLTGQNNVKPIARRPANDFDGSGNYQYDPLSRVPEALLPHDEKLRISYTLHDKLPPNLRGDWGSTTLKAKLGAKELDLTVASNVLTTQTLSQAEVGAPFGYTAESIARNLSITIP